MIVETKVIGRPAELLDHEVSGLVGESTLRRVLTELVNAEVAAYEQRRAETRLLSVLTPGDLAAGHIDGRITSGGRPVPAAPPAAQAVARAMEAFTDGLVLAVLDGRPVDELDAPLMLLPHSRLRLVRVVALAGG